VTDLLTAEAAVLMVVVGIAIIWSGGDVRRLTALWAVFLPIDRMTGIDPVVFDTIRYAGGALLVMMVGADEPVAVDRTVRRLVVAILALAATRLAAGIWHPDPDSLRYGLAMVAGVLLASMIVRRRCLLPAAAAGYLAGLALSAVVSLLQASHVATLAPSDATAQRYPGLAAYTTVVSWHMATGLVLACTLMVLSWRSAPRLVFLGAVLVIIFNGGLVSNGAQGGFLGVAAAGLTVVVLLRHSARLRTLLAVVGATAVLFVGTVAGAAVLGVDIPTITDYRSDNFANEIARIDSVKNGIEQFRSHPLTGVPSADFDAMYGEFPHFLPVESAALTGILGLLAASVVLVMAGAIVLRRPGFDGAMNVAAHALLALLVASFLTGPNGPILGIARTLPLLAAVTLASYPTELVRRDCAASEVGRRASSGVNIDG